MKKSRIFLATGAFALAISAVFATKANKKFAGTLSTAYAGVGSGLYVKYAGGNFFTAKSGGNLVTAYLQLYTAGTHEIGPKVELFTSAGAHAIFMPKP